MNEFNNCETIKDLDDQFFSSIAKQARYRIYMKGRTRRKLEKNKTKEYFLKYKIFTQDNAHEIREFIETKYPDTKKSLWIRLLLLPFHLFFWLYRYLLGKTTIVRFVQLPAASNAEPALPVSCTAKQPAAELLSHAVTTEDW